MMQVPLPQQRGSSFMCNSWLSLPTIQPLFHKAPHGGETTFDRKHLPSQPGRTIAVQPGNGVGHLVGRLHAAQRQHLRTRICADAGTCHRTA